MVVFRLACRFFGPALQLPWVLIILLQLVPEAAGQQLPGPNMRYLKQGFDLRLYVTNTGSNGTPFFSGVNLAGDSISCEYPVGSMIEHLSEQAIWVGGVLDTSSGKIPSYDTLVSTGADNDSVYCSRDFWPSANPEDHIWVTSKGSAEPIGLERKGIRRIPCL